MSAVSLSVSNKKQGESLKTSKYKHKLLIANVSVGGSTIPPQNITVLEITYTFTQKNPRAIKLEGFKLLLQV